MKTESILMVDGYSLLYRAFHALPILTDSKGRYTNAVHGFFSMLFKALDDYRPDGLCVMMDMHAPTFRHTRYADYKGTRKPMPEELRPQVGTLREILSAMEITVLELEGYEADDLLGSLSRMANEKGMLSYLLTGDRDSLQLVGSGTRVILTRKGLTESLLLDRDGVIANFGYTPEQVPDLKGLMGDTSDNIPGIAGIGEKTALKLLGEYGTLDSVLEHADSIKGKLGEKIRLGKESALLSRELGTICRTAPIKADLTKLPWKQISQGIPILEDYEMNTLCRTIQTLLGKESTSAQPSVRRGTGASIKASGNNKVSAVAESMLVESEEELPKPENPTVTIEIQSEDQLKEITALIEKSDWVCLCHLQDGMSLRLSDGTLFIAGYPVDLLSTGIYPERLWPALVTALKGKTIITHNAKEFQHELDRMNLSPIDIRFDTMLAAYLCHTALRSYSLESVLKEEGIEFDNIPTAQQVYTLWLRLNVRMEKRHLLPLFTQVEMPLSGVLFAMEKTGFSVNAKMLRSLGTSFGEELDELQKQIFEMCGTSFNLNSPRQLGEILFDKLGLPTDQKKGKTGYSTTAEILEGLIDYHPVIEPILRYRKLQKLKSTYVEGLLPLIDSRGRVHSTFDQTATVTGRISSLEPNLQNIPIRTEEGRVLRGAFVPREGWVLVDADYSQIELRVLAHMSQDDAMCDAFRKGQDIHLRTAAEIHGISMNEVTPEMRRSAKAVNFGIVYGISSFGLSKNAHISRKEADSFIKTYFLRYPKVKQYMDDCVRKGMQDGYTETLMGRRRELFELRSSNRNVRSFGERAAMNTPVQGTAADLIKLAMVRVHQRLEKEGFKARLILQVHDELVLECPPSEKEAVEKLLQQTMEGAAQLLVPLIAEVHCGATWEEAH